MSIFPSRRVFFPKRFHQPFALPRFLSLHAPGLGSLPLFTPHHYASFIIFARGQVAQVWNSSPRCLFAPKPRAHLRLCALVEGWRTGAAKAQKRKGARCWIGHFLLPRVLSLALGCPFLQRLGDPEALGIPQRYVHAGPRSGSQANFFSCPQELCTLVGRDVGYQA